MEFARVHLLKVVGGRVVNVEVALRVGENFARRGAEQIQRGDIGTTTAGDEQGQAVGFEKFRPTRGARDGVELRTGELEAARLKAAVVGFEGEDMFFAGLARDVGVGVAPRRPFSSLVNKTARSVWRGLSPSVLKRRRTSMAWTTPEPSSWAPGAMSQESRWPPTTMIWSGNSEPRISPMTLCERASG